MSDQIQSKIDWKEIAITAVISLFIAAAVVAGNQHILTPAIKKMKDKKAAAKDKDTAKK